MVLMIMRHRISHTQSRRFISFQNTRKSCFNLVGCTTPTIIHTFTRQSRSNRCFQFLTSMLDGFFEFLILQVDEIDSSQFSCVFKMELFFRPLLLSPSAWRAFPLFSRVLEINDLAWMSAVFSLISSRTTRILLEVFLPIE